MGSTTRFSFIWCLLGIYSEPLQCYSTSINRKNSHKLFSIIFSRTHQSKKVAGSKPSCMKVPWWSQKKKEKQNNFRFGWEQVDWIDKTIIIRVHFGATSFGSLIVCMHAWCKTRYIDPVSRPSHLKWSGMHVLPGSLATYIPNISENAPGTRNVSSHTSLMAS